MTKKKNLALVICLVLVTALVSVGGTIAWLTDSTEKVENTFTVGNIDIELDESDDLDLKMVPGTVITKDPYVTVKGGSEACWVFVKVEEHNNLDYFITYTIDSTWTQLEDGSDVYYKQVAAADADQVIKVLTNDKVSVNDKVSKDDMNELETLSEDKYPKLSFTAYAIQQAKFDTAAAAWAELNKE